MSSGAGIGPEVCFDRETPGRKVAATVSRNRRKTAGSTSQLGSQLGQIFLPWVLFALMAGCRNSQSKSTTGELAKPNFAVTVVVGDSLSAGYQNGTLLDALQPNGWASLVAKQANFKLVLPLIAPPGEPAVLELTALGPPPVITQTSGTTTGRDDPTIQPTDLAVPGHTLSDLMNYAPPAVAESEEDLYTKLVLGYPIGNTKTQMDETIALQPTALFIWIGSNDALHAVGGGSPSLMTPLNTFTQQFAQLMTTLHAQTKATLIVANLFDVTIVPYLISGATIIEDVANETGISEETAASALGIDAEDLVNAIGQSQAQNAVAAIKRGEAPTPLTDAGFLNAIEIATIQSTVNQYNAAIAQQVAEVGGVLVDIHTLFENLQQNGMVINGYEATNGFLGGIFSLDGIHPTNTGYALIASQFIQAMNMRLETSIPDVNVSAVAAADPYFGANIKPTGEERKIP